MISICEPQCKTFSHEKFNSGFLYGLRLAFPQERLRCYAHASHIAAIQAILVRDGIVIGNIEYVPIDFRIGPGVLRAIGYRALLLRVFRETIASGTDKMFFLSFNAELLWLIKRFKAWREFRELKFTLVLHGAFESIADADPAASSAVAAPSVLAGESLSSKLRRTRIAAVPGKALGVARRTAGKVFTPWRSLTSRLLTEKKALLWRHSVDFHYVCLAPHVRANAARYLDVERLNFHTVVLPTIFAPAAAAPDNKHVKFAMFGYGNPPALHEVLLALARRGLAADYEIRIIGMDTRGTAGFAHVTCPSPGKPLERADMERLAQDIDMFLILYDRSRYRLSCSGAILEALSLMKPVLYLDNECVNGFNAPERPIGIRCDDLGQLAGKIMEIADDYAGFQPSLTEFRANILKVRHECSIEQSVPALRQSFTW